MKKIDSKYIYGKRSTEDLNKQRDENAFNFKDRSFIKNFDNLYNLYNKGYYHRLETLQEDVKYLIEKTIRTRCKN